MKYMPFPKIYEKTLKKGKKNVTIRILNEVGKYKRNETYQATNDKGNLIPFLIKIVKVVRLKFKDAKKYIPKVELNLKEFKNMKPSSNVDMIRFECVFLENILPH